jgi:sulfate/thiosulfate transport system substrate-binding protein
MRSTRIGLLALASLALALVVAACGSSGGGDSKQLSLVAYSTPQEAYEKVIPAFQKTEGGAGISFKQSYGASGDQARAVQAGLPADVVALSLEPDVQKLVDAGKVAQNWAAGPTKGIVTHSVVVFAVRKDNPKNIRTWADLVKPGVQIITPNPQTSGGAKWNLTAAYGANSNAGKDQAAGEAYLKKFFGNVAVADKSARDALQTFSSGKGDVLISYENEAITAQKKGIDLDYVIPTQTILIQNPIALTTGSANPTAAKAFVDFALKPEAQKLFAQSGYRPVDPKLVDKKQFPTPPGLFTVAQLGGWSKVNKQLFDEKDGVVTKIQSAAGV